MKLTKKKLLWGGVVLLVLAALVALALVARQNGWLDVFLERESMRDFIDRAGLWGPLVFIALQIVQVVVSFIPGGVTTIVGGALFGTGLGFLYSFVAIIIGSVISFFIARKLGNVVVRKMVGGKAYDRYYAVIHSEGTLSRTRLTLFATMLLPFFPDDLICLLAGITPIPFWQFLVTIVLARPMGLLFSSLLGSGALRMPLWAMVLAAAASIALGVLTFKFAPAIEKKLLALLEKVRG